MKRFVQLISLAAVLMSGVAYAQTPGLRMNGLQLGSFASGASIVTRGLYWNSVDNLPHLIVPGTGDLPVAVLTSSYGFDSFTSRPLLFGELNAQYGQIGTLTHPIPFGIGIAPQYGLDVLGGGARLRALTVSAAPTVTVTGSAGATSWSYYCVAVDTAGNRTNASSTATVANGNATLTGSNYNAVQCTAVSGAVGFDVVRTAAGGTPSTTGAIAFNIALGTINDTGLSASTYTTPSGNRTADLRVDGQIQASQVDGAGGTLSLCTQGGSNGSSACSVGRAGIATTWNGTQLTLTQGAAASGSPSIVSLTGGAHLTLANAEAPDVSWNLSRTVQFTGGVGAFTQRAILIQPPTYSAGAAQTLTAATFTITGAPAAGTNVTINPGYALWITAGLSRFDGGIQVNSGNISALQSGALISSQHIGGSGTAPTVAVGAGAQLGTSPAAAITQGTDTGFIVTVTTGTTPSAFTANTAVTAATVTYNATYTSTATAPMCRPAGLTSAALATGASGIVVYADFAAATATTLPIKLVSSGTPTIAASTAYAFVCHTFK